MDVERHPSVIGASSLTMRCQMTRHWSVIPASSPEEATSDDNINGDNVLDADRYPSGDANDADDAPFPTPVSPESDEEALTEAESRQIEGNAQEV